METSLASVDRESGYTGLIALDKNMSYSYTAFLFMHFRNQKRKEGVMKYLLTVMLVPVVMLSLAACMPVASPLVGIIYTDAKYGDTATTAAAETKVGKACATTILSLIATGDASVTAAKAPGGITVVSTVDHTAKSILGIYAEWCTVVKGS